VAQGPPAAFFSYCRDDSEFALRLAEDLKAAGANVWLDQLDIEPGMPWDRAVENAVTNCPRMLVILSPTSVKSDNVRDEISFALSKQKRVIPVLYRECDVPFRLARLQHIDFRTDYARGLKVLLRTLDVEQQAVAAGGAAVSGVPKEGQPDVPDLDERERAAEHAPLEQERKRAAEQARVEEQRKQAAEQARLGEERQEAARQAQLEEERKQAAEQARVEQEHRRAARVIGVSTASKFNPSRIASATIRRYIGAAAIILIIAVGSRLVYHYGSIGPLFAAIVLVTLWLLVGAIHSYVGGWFSLSKVYRTRVPFNGTKWRGQSGQMRWLANYNNLTLGANHEGLYLASMPLFRFMHPPLLVPWSEIRVRKSKGWFFEYVTFTMGHEPGIPLRIRAKLAGGLAGVAGSRWPVQET
jgi:TIR domain